MENTCETENKPQTFKEYLQSGKFRKSTLSIVAGGIIGFAYYYFIGCNSGSCAITNDWFSSVAAGAFIGFFIVNKPCKTC